MLKRREKERKEKERRKREKGFTLSPAKIEFPSFEVRLMEYL